MTYSLIIVHLPDGSIKQHYNCSYKIYNGMLMIDFGVDSTVSFTYAPGYWACFITH